MVRRETGQLEAVRHLVTGTEAPAEHWAPGLLALYTEFRLTDPTRRVLRWICDQLGRYEASGDWPATLAFLVEAALWLRDEEAAGLLRHRLLDYAQLNLVAGPFVAVFGSADRYLGAVDSLLGRGTAEEWFVSALEMDTRMNAVVHQAYTLAEHAGHLRRTGSSRAQAAILTDEALALARPLSLRRVLRSIGSGERELEARPDRLTAREVEVLRLLAMGHSNRDIATRLVISENTAANHVRSILLKTGSSNRTQAARYAAGNGLLG